MEFTQEHLNIIKNDTRYRDFTLCDPAKPFCDMPEFDKDIAVVQLHSLQIFDCEQGKSIVGFCGCFEWKDHKAIALDGDSYSETVHVFGYHWFESEDGIQCLDILVGDDW